jgi:SAM-dependent methyltransferase
MRRCRECRSVYASAVPDTAVEDYAGYYHEGNLVVPEIVHRRLGEVVRSFDSYRLSNRWLDVGCGAGALLEAAAGEGWDAEGTEVASAAVARLAARGLTVYEGELDALPLRAGDYDVVSLVEVLEHVADPTALMATAARLLRPGGVAYITTPHARGLSGRALGLRWTLVSPPEHLQLFSRPGLRALALRAGLEERAARTDGVNPYELLSALRRSEPAAGSERVQHAYALNTTLQRRWAGRLARRIVNEVLNVTRLGDGLKYVAVRPQA